MGAFVYMLRCADGSYYVGSATGEDLWKRVTEHETGAYPDTRIRAARFAWFGPSILSRSRMRSRWNERSRDGAARKRKH